MSPQQLHNRLGDAQAKAILASYVAAEIAVEHAMAGLGLKRAQFFACFETLQS